MSSAVRTCFPYKISKESTQVLASAHRLMAWADSWIFPFRYVNENTERKWQESPGVVWTQAKTGSKRKSGKTRTSAGQELLAEPQTRHANSNRPTTARSMAGSTVFS